MLRLNKSHQLLAGASSAVYARKYSGSLILSDEASSKRSILLPKQDPNYASLKAEAMLQIIRQSKLAGKLAEFDPINTYNYPLNGPPIFSYSMVGSSLTPFVGVKDDTSPWVVLGVNLALDLSLGTYKASHELGKKTGRVEFVANSSNDMDIGAGMVVRLQGSPALSENMSFTCEKPLYLDWAAELVGMEALYPWSEEMVAIYRSEGSPVERLAAGCMSLIEYLESEAVWR